MDASRSRLHALIARARAVERREMGDFREWLEHTSNLLHLSVVVFVPLLIGLVTYVFNRVDVLPFLLFPPLASGTYTLFAEPEGRYADPTRFVAGMTAGALCGWFALWLTEHTYAVPAGPYTAHAGAAAFGVFLTGVVTWALDAEHPMAFSTALLILVVGTSQLVYVASVVVSSAVVAGVFSIWRRQVYEQRGEYLYRSTKGDDHVLVPMRGEYRIATAVLGARLAAAHEAGKVVLLDVVGDEDVASAKRDVLSGNGQRAAADLTTDGGPATTGADADRSSDDRDAGFDEGDNTGNTSAIGDDADSTGNVDTDDGEGTIDEGTIANALERDREGNPSLRERAEGHVAAEAAGGLERCAARIEREIGVPCEVAVVASDDEQAQPAIETARTENCDLIVAPYEADDGDVSGFVTGLFDNDIDALIHRSVEGRTEWNRIMVPVREPSSISHTMIDFAERLAGTGCSVSVSHCVGEKGDRRAAERMLADLVETCRGDVETRVARRPIEEFLRSCAPEYDLVVVGASSDRSAASRLLSPPTFERLDDLDCDVAIVHR